MGCQDQPFEGVRSHPLKPSNSLLTLGPMCPTFADGIQVARVIDGDTIQVLSDGRQYAVRLIGADTPETKHPTEAVQRFGQEASAFTTAALEGRTVQLETDRTGDTVDRYGRLLCYVYLDGQNFNARLISEGYAHAIRGFRYSERAAFIRLEEAAKRLGKGLWSPP